jgi:hypothetical protein
MKKIFFALLFLMCAINAIAQDRYVVFFKDKANSPYQLNNPSAYLTQRAIERRVRMSIAIDSADIPVNASYLSGVASKGAKILNTSRWFNSAIVQADTSQIIAVGTLNYVHSYVKMFGENLHKTIIKPKYEEVMEENGNANRSKILGGYGGASNQTQMLNADLLHNAGYTGKNTVIAVIDAGFINTDTHRAFDSLRIQNKILGTWDFSKNNAFVYDYSNHGTSVLSCIAANVPDTMIGTAPHAKFYLLRSEEEATEYEVEEYNWASAAEYADSVGADIINSSLGYTEFDAKSQNHTYAEMNGNTTVVSMAAKKANSKGVLVVNSAGNSGNDPWYYIGAPADVDEVFSVAAVKPDRSIAGFSSRGPTSDQRIKPDASAQGSPAYVARVSGGFGTGSGTSFAGPILAGFSACAWELYKVNHPNSTPAQVKAWIKQYSDRASQPDNEYGFGIPDGSKLLLNASVDTNPSASYRIYPNPNKGTLYIKSSSGNTILWSLEISDMLGKIIYTSTFNTIDLLMGIELPANISRGFYILSLSSNNDAYKQVFIRE